MSFWRTLADLLLPRHCVVCGAELDSTEQDLCNVCLCRIVHVTWTSAVDNPLLRTLWDRHEVDAAGCSFYYNSSSDFHNIFIAIKYKGCPKLGERLARLSFPLWHTLGLGQGADYIIPVPLSMRRRLKRGYNQAEWIARGVAASTGIPLCTDVLVRRKSNETQTHKTAGQRQENTRNIFEARKDRTNLNGRTVLLVDDIMTTGATISDSIRALREVFPTVRVQIYTLGWAGER
jgi:ComF family protein